MHADRPPEAKTGHARDNVAYAQRSEQLSGSKGIKDSTLHTCTHTLIKLAIPSHLVGNISSRYIHAGCWHTMHPHTHGAYECCTVTVQMLQMGLWVCRVRVCASVCEFVCLWFGLACAKGRCQFRCGCGSFYCHAHMGAGGTRVEASRLENG